MRFYFLVLSLFSGYAAQTQGMQNFTYYDGTPAMEKTATHVEGIELLYEEWLLGTIATPDGQVFDQVKLKYNVFSNQLFFLGKDGQSMLFVTPVREFSIGDSESGTLQTYRNGYPKLFGADATTFYKVLAGGSIQLLKRNQRKIVDIKEYNSASIRKVIQDEIQYYLFADGQLQPVKKDKDFLKKILPMHAAKIDSLSAGLSPKKEADFIHLINLLNSGR